MWPKYIIEDNFLYHRHIHTIRNIEFNASSQNEHQGHYVVGAQFIDMTDEMRLGLSSYIYEHDRK